MDLSDDKQIYERYAEPIERFFCNKTSSPLDAEDLLHQTFERFFLRRVSTEVAVPEKFLYGIAKKVLLEYWRGKERRLRHEDIGERSLQDLGSGVSTLVARAQSQRRVFDALREIPLNQQMVVELYYWEGKSYREISELLDIPMGTVGTWMRRGRALLRRRLSTKGEGDDGRARLEDAHPQGPPRHDAAE